MPSSLPRIGITLDHETTPHYSKYPWYALRENYCGSIAEAGGLPLPLPYHSILAGEYLSLIDGLVVTGGNFDVSPEYYGQKTLSDTVSVKNARTAFEYAMVEGALARKIPILGICGGQQLLNVVLGGTLVQHIPDSFPDSPLQHEQPNPRHEVGHSVSITSHTQLHRIITAQHIMVNSAHHQAVDKVADGVVVNATASDGVIEGIEYPAHPFCIGVQWHPEFFITDADRALYHAFIGACQH
jgi:putative glutamine amidotransferase